jgi:SNF2 family DNA or RNA helicase
MQNSIMDLYGLIDFIDTGALGDVDEFYKRYFRKPERYGELTAITSRYCFRTLRSQVESYVKIPNRIPVTADYMLSDKEVKLAAMVDSYLKKSDKLAFPKMEEYDLTLMFNRALSSSPWALAGLADTACERTQGAESELVEMAEFAAEIQPKDTGKGRDLLKVLKIAFTELKKRGANRKAIIFTENRSTMGFLHVLLSDKYNTLAFDGSKSSDYSVIKKFEHDSENAEILIATSIAAEGFNLEFCSFVVNFDLPYNVLALEQRIMRCHRKGQLNDVIVLNFLQAEFRRCANA